MTKCVTTAPFQPSEKHEKEYLKFQRIFENFTTIR